MPAKKNIVKDNDGTQQKGILRNPTRRSSIHYDYIMNGYDLSPRYIQAGASNMSGSVSGAGSIGAFFQENGKPVPFKKLFPHKHARNEYFIFMSTNPDKPDDLGSTTEFWIGEGEAAEPYIITKPTVIVLPPNTVHLPEAHRESHGTTAQAVVYDGSLFSCCEVKKLSPRFDPQKSAAGKFDRKYQYCVNERDIANAAFFPSHKGKAQVILHHDLRENEHTTHVIEASLISKSGIGWGCGDMMQFPDYQIRSLPHIHDVLETYVFIGTNPDNYEDLGGTLEFWMDEGEKAKKFVINKPTVLLVPPNTTHLPLYVNELRTPIIALSILDSPLMSIYYTDKFPTGFEHVSIPPESMPGKYQLKYEKTKCTYPECRVCMDNCQVHGIDLSRKPPVVGKPCLRCGMCALLCPEGAITAKVTN